MSRPLRIELAGVLYHVTSRGDRRENIYENDEDQKKYFKKAKQSLIFMLRQ